MTNEEAKTLKPGDKITINTLVAVVEAIHPRFDGDVMIRTEYGDFNASVCEKTA